MRANRNILAGEAADGKGVWFWHPWLVSSWRRLICHNRASIDRQFVSDGGQRNSAPGRARYKPLKPLRREGRVFRRTCSPPCAPLCARLRVSWAPGLPCALFDFRGQRRSQNSGAMCRENVEMCLPSLRAERSNPSLRARRAMDCFVAALLAMTRSERWWLFDIRIRALSSVTKTCLVTNKRPPRRLS
jgi:hypothetical protein